MIRCVLMVNHKIGVTGLGLPSLSAIDALKPPVDKREARKKKQHLRELARRQKRLEKINANN